ncbi:GAC1 [Candida margitis]|uniref:GAC1 n=1 Tax=Candida margitis TaxID=1775924 RepID=UPI002225BB8E|nr:GAC1 [Candida margitis]KAI5970775.1 GAC1 [Candida margitis]
MSTIVTIDPSHTYSISPPSSTTCSSRSSSPVASFYQNSSTTTSASSSTDSLDTVKSTTSTSTIKLLPPSSSESITIPISRTPTPSSLSSLSQQSQQSQQQPQASQSKFKLPNYYVPPAKLVHPTIAVTSPPPQTPSTTNASTSTSTLQSAASLTVKPPLLRKKSGELIKSSLKLPGLLQRSVSSPHISSDNELGGIVSPRKSVRFASRLINVRMFDGCDTPASVSSAGSPIDSPEEGEAEQDYFYKFGKQSTGATASDGLFDLSVPAFEDFEFSKFTNKTTNFDWNFNFSKPKDEVKEYRLTSHNIPSTNITTNTTTTTTTSKTNSSSNEKIWMTSAYLLKVNNKTYLCGWLNVVNIAFSKEINLKLTIDNWASSIIVGGITKYQKSLDSVLDQFKFMLDLESFNITTEKTIELCLEYNTNGQTYWGNNMHQNYKFNIERKIQKPVGNNASQTGAQQKQRSRSKSASGSGSALNNHKQSINSSGYEEICTKLVNHKSTLALNFANDEFSFRPSLKKSFSASDIASSNTGATSTSYGTPRYSNRQRQKENNNNNKKQGRGAMDSTPSSNGGGIKDMTYADILQKYCFAGTPPAATHTTATNVSAASVTSSAPTSSHSSPLLRPSSPSSSSSCPSPPVAAIAAPTQTSIYI